MTTASNRRKRVNYSLIHEAVRTADRPVQFLEILCNREDAVAGAYWSSEGNPFGQGTFVLRAVFGRPSAVSLVGEASFHIDDANLFAMEAIVAKQARIKKIIGSKLGKAWLAKNYTIDLKELGVNSLLVIPVFNSQGIAIALFSLYFVQPCKTNLSEIFHICQIQATAINAAENSVEAGALERLKSRHEILAHSRIITQKLDEILREFVKIQHLLPDYILVKKKFEDTIRSARVLNNSFDRGTFKERVTARRKFAVWTDLTQCLRDCLAAESKVTGGANSILRGTIPNSDWEIDFYKDDFQILLRNIYANGLKYATAGSVIRTKVADQNGRMVLTIHNDVEFSRDDDLEKIWQYEYRGKYAENSKISGQGIGLGLVNDICDVYGLSASAEFVEFGDRRLTKEFVLGLTFPKESYQVKKDGHV
jgi:hypothetical protein